VNSYFNVNGKKKWEMYRIKEKMGQEIRGERFYIVCFCSAVSCCWQGLELVAGGVL
jgi:hypothetical protein